MGNEGLGYQGVVDRVGVAFGSGMLGRRNNYIRKTPTATERPDNERVATAVRLGYFPNVTHAPALVGVADGLFQAELGDVPLETFTFNAGTEAIEALFAEAIDMTFIGPNPAINAYAQSEGAAIRIISGSTSGGAALVVKPEVERACGSGRTQDRHALSWQHPGRGSPRLAAGARL